MIDKIECFICGEGTLSENILFPERECNGYKEKVRLETLVCDTCECTTLSDEQSIRNVEQMKAFYERAYS